MPTRSGPSTDQGPEVSTAAIAVLLAARVALPFLLLFGLLAAVS